MYGTLSAACPLPLKLSHELYSEWEGGKDSFLSVEWKPQFGSPP